MTFKARGLVVACVVMAGCSRLPQFTVDGVRDNVKYKEGGSSVSKLTIPSDLSAPNFDDTFVLNRVMTPAEAQAAQARAVPPSAQAETKATVAQAPTKLTAKLGKLADGNPTLIVDGGYDAIWTRTGEVIKDAGIQITQQEKDKGIYALTEPSSKIKAQLIISDEGTRSLIVVANEQGKPVKPEIATPLLNSLKAEI